MAVTLPVLHFNDVYRVFQTSKEGAISADQFAAKIARIRTEKWGEQSRSLAFLEGDGDDGVKEGHTSSSSSSSSLHGLTLFSGDVFNPSIESSVTRGSHMVEVLNAMSIDNATLGNHDFDYGYSHLTKLMQQTNFAWTFSNIADVGHSDPQRGNEEDPQADDGQVQGTLRSWVCDVEVGEGEKRESVRVGCIGLVERDWIATVPAFPPNFRYRSMVKTGLRLSKALRDPDGPHRCDLIVALTHCRLPNDIDLANALHAVLDPPDDEHGVDLVLGGHDHTYYVGKGVAQFEGEEWQTSLPGKEKDEKCLLVKSGTDFHDLSEIELTLSAPKPGVVRRRRITAAKVTRHKTKPTDPSLPPLKEHIDELLKRVDEATGQPVAFSLTPLNCCMDSVRTKESAVGSFVADILLHSYDGPLRNRDERGELGDRRGANEREVDMALICGGSLRGDSVFGPGVITLRDVLTIMPFEDAVIVRQLKGKDILAALENGFGAYPSQEGRFPQVAGVSIVWDSSKPSGSRLVEVRLLDDVHLFNDDGTRRSESGSNSGEATPSSAAAVEEEGEGAETYAFKRSQEGGYTIEVTKPRISRGALLDPERIYRVVTREYMADGHDGYEALTRQAGPDLIDHENGSLMSTQVRKFLLGASLIWRLKALRDHTDPSGVGFVGHLDTLSTKTRKAIERARALSSGQGTIRGHDDQGSVSSAQDRDGVKPSPLQVTSAGAESRHAFSTPPRKKLAADAQQSNGDSSTFGNQRLVVDSSPGAFRDAMLAGASEHHSWHDAASKHFQTSRLQPFSAGGYRHHPGDQSIASSNGGDRKGDEPSSAPAHVWRAEHSDLTMSSSASADDEDALLQRQGSSSPSAARHMLPPTTASTVGGESLDDVLMTNSSYFTPKAVRSQVEVSAEDGELLRSAKGDLAIIAPMRDGRIVDRGQKTK